MMKLAVPVLSLFLVLSPSQAKTNESAQVQVSRNHSVLKTPTRMKSVLVRAIPRAQRRLLITNDLTDGDDGPPGANELDLQGPYRRPRVVSEPIEDSNQDQASDYITVRLAVARARAMEVYRQKWV